MRDSQLIRRYVEQKSEAAFTEIVRRHARLVYNTCFRETRNALLAEDAAQAVFLILARKAGGLRNHASLGSWLFKTARYVSMNALAQDRKRLAREAAVMQTATVQSDTDSIWRQIEPELNAAISALREQDREAVVLRYLEGRSNREIGDALGVSEKTAHMRVTRAVERLRLYLEREGITTSPAVLPLCLDLAHKHAEPSGFVHAVSHSAMSAQSASICSPAYQLAQGVIRKMLFTKFEMLGVTTLAGVSAVCVYGMVTHAVLTSYHVPSASMEPTISQNAVVSVAGNAYASPKQVRRGDIVLFHPPGEKQTLTYIKRVVGLPGDHIRASGGDVWINGNQLQHSQLKEGSDTVTYRETNGKAAYIVQYRKIGPGSTFKSADATVPDSAFYVMGDNRDNALDSREYGPVQFTSIVGKETAIIGQAAAPPAKPSANINR